jgi:hypothetical protein
MAEFTIPYGRAKDTPLSEASTEEINFIAKGMLKKEQEDPNHRFAADNKKWLTAARAELDKRGVPRPGAKGKPAPAPAAPAPNGQAIVVAEPSAMSLVGAFGDPSVATAALLNALKHYHVVTPAMSVGGIPEGCEIYTAMVVVEPYGIEVYNITGNRKAPKDDDTVGLDRVALMKIAGAAAVTWIASRRTDDRSEAFYCSWEAILEYKQFDGTVCRVPGNVDIDARPGGAAYMEIMQKGNDRGRDPEKQLLELRKFLARHCESKAMNKAIANMGVRRSYKRSDLKKPFLVARLAATGRSNDPELQREFSKMKFQQLISGSQALYPSAPQLPPRIDEESALVAPPPLPDGYSEPDDNDDDPWADFETTGEEPKSEPKAAQGEGSGGGSGQQPMKF